MGKYRASTLKCMNATHTAQSFSFGGTLEALNGSQVSNLDAAIANARAFASEVIAILRGEKRVFRRWR